MVNIIVLVHGFWFETRSRIRIPIPGISYITTTLISLDTTTLILHQNTIQLDLDTITYLVPHPIKRRKPQHIFSRITESMKTCHPLCFFLFHIFVCFFFPHFPLLPVPFFVSVKEPTPESPIPISNQRLLPRNMWSIGWHLGCRRFKKPETKLRCPFGSRILNGGVFKGRG